ncbi:hypothetical protein [Pantoea stewartii]|uniref:Uncharacterized protein n=1 Tax=Pantoea stewartii subsp. stewartii DC283 TaxID=660596 RepID=H3RBN9_PANSE|nr:hypothetical protein [Pantoea stewartii]ARF49680.1 hypothetical protein DSJ_10230 [Pantoea stewartii subsp. stewartii DC283]EHU01378.1 hypothetical protein CKS_4131 [Pantoea stewartii subsp. stewartii DC283]KAB0551410.1 hypothetical protein F7Q90_18180 [Pantoea stewartii subsp. stewartii]
MDVNLFISSVKSAVGALSTIQTNEVLRERIAFIYEQIEVIQKASESAQKELAQLKAKNIELEKEIAAYRAKDEFVQHMGAAFRKNTSGEYVKAVYCPNCLKQVGSGDIDFPFHCGTCNWYSEFDGGSLSFIMESLPK